MIVYATVVKAQGLCMDYTSQIIGEAAFKKHEDAWWDPSGPYRLLHQLTPLRLQWIRAQWAEHTHKPLEALKRPWLSDVRVLDVGCGGGLLSEPLARQGAHVTGIDARPAHIDAAKAHDDSQEGLRLDYCAQSLEGYAQSNAAASFDLVIAFEVIEHVRDPLAFLKSVNRLLKPGGLCLLSTINRTTRSAIKAIFVAEQVLGWIPPGTHSWDAFITPHELKHLTIGLGWDVANVSGLTYDLWRQTWQLSAYTDTNYFMAFLKTNSKKIK
jgi:2-polyprenyl-6-hydroxyphenyl methylase/3-demethylubiquinone-9 3-methyltransferase